MSQETSTPQAVPERDEYAYHCKKSTRHPWYIASSQTGLSPVVVGMNGCHVSTNFSACQNNCSPQSSVLNRHVLVPSRKSCTIVELLNASQQGGRLVQPLTRQKLLLSQLHRASHRQRRVRARSHAVYAAAASIKDPYKVLGVETTATDQLIKKAFKQKAKQLHPDVNKAVSNLYLTSSVSSL